MKTINKLMLDDITNKWQFSLKEDQFEILFDELSFICDAMHKVDEIKEVSDLSPMVFPFDVSTSYLREDVASSPLSQEEVLKNASEVRNGQIVLPKVIK